MSPLIFFCYRKLKNIQILHQQVRGLGVKPKLLVSLIHLGEGNGDVILKYVHPKKNCDP